MTKNNIINYYIGHYNTDCKSVLSRVSFDTRVLSLAHHHEDWTDRLGRRCLFRVGQYYKVPFSVNK